MSPSQSCRDDARHSKPYRPALDRPHSEWLTGDVLGSLKCDCGPQLHAAIDAIRAAGWGILLYLRREGRGIGTSCNTPKLTVV